MCQAQVLVQVDSRGGRGEGQDFPWKPVKEQKSGVGPVEGPVGAKVPLLGLDSASGWSYWRPGCRVGGNQGAWTPVARAQGLGSRGTRGGGWDSARPAPCPQVEMLYEEALYTVVYRAGTMGPDQVDDEETLLGYLQQVSPTGSALPAGPAPPWGEWR